MNNISKPSVSGEKHQRVVSEKDAEIQRLKVSLNQQIQAWQFEYGKAKQYEEQIQHLKSSRVKDIEDAIQAGDFFITKTCNRLQQCLHADDSTVYSEGINDELYNKREDCIKVVMPNKYEIH